MAVVDPTRIGRVRHVLGATVTVELDHELAGVTPVYKGELLPIGQIGSLVRIPQGLVDIVGTVSLLGIAELAGPQVPSETVQIGDRWLQIQLLGQIDRGSKGFERGVASFPGLDDAVHFATADDLAAVFPRPSQDRLRLGRLAAAEHVPVCLDVSKLVLRHTAIVGSTGAGKSSAVASILQSLVAGGWSGANVVVIDPHGEYAHALGDSASSLSVLASGDNQLQVPYWALPADDLLRVLTGAAGGGTVGRRFTQLVTEGRRVFAAGAGWLNLDPAAVTADTPVPFDIRQVWWQLQYENTETRTTKKDPSTVCLVDRGNAKELVAPTFTPYGPAGAEPHQSDLFDTYGAAPERLRLAIKDPRFQFLMSPEGDPDGSDPLVEVISRWLGGGKPVSILNFAGVPPDAAELAIGVVLQLLFEVALRSDPDGHGIGRPNPVLVVLEEAHRYLGEGSGFSSGAASRIAREGRKYGVGLLLVTQRPSELPETALAQCGTMISLRLGNSQDQGHIRAALPDSVTGLAATLPSLRTGEAVVSGEATTLPVRFLIDKPDPGPKADDPSLARWLKGPEKLDLSPALASWRGTYEEGDNA
jgi:hypothetical protein